jgi:hypothetical protein
MIRTLSTLQSSEMWCVAHQMGIKIFMDLLSAPSSEMVVSIYKNLQHHIPEILATVYKILHFRRLSYFSHCQNLKSHTFLQFPFCHPTSLIICIDCLMPLTVLMNKLCSFLQSPVTQFFISWTPSYELCSWKWYYSKFFFEHHLPIMWETCFKKHIQELVKLYTIYLKCFGQATGW